MEVVCIDQSVLKVFVSSLAEDGARIVQGFSVVGSPEYFPCFFDDSLERVISRNMGSDKEELIVF